MFSKIYTLFVIACLIATIAATPILENHLNDLEGELINGYEQPKYQYPHSILEEPTVLEHKRFVRSPGGGSVQIDYNQDRFGKRGSVQYNQNLYKSNDGRLTVDAYARGERHFDMNRNSYGGGIQGSYHFG